MKIKWKIFEITFAKEKLKHLKYVTTSDREITETVRDLRKKVSHSHGPGNGTSVEWDDRRCKREFLETYEPLECTVFLENQNRCFQFWSNVAERYSQKGIFEDRGGYPDKNAENIIKTELKSKNNLPYKARLFYFSPDS